MRLRISVAVLAIFAAAANGCLQGEISTDRSDVTNSRIVVPVSSLQSEIGVNVSDCRPNTELGSG